LSPSLVLALCRSWSLKQSQAAGVNAPSVQKLKAAIDYAKKNKVVPVTRR
jgi:hypothetical protein